MSITCPENTIFWSSGLFPQVLPQIVPDTSLHIGTVWCWNHSSGPQSRSEIVQHARVPFSTCGTGESARKSRGRWWERERGGLIICWLCSLVSLSTQICMLMSWGSSAVFGSAVGRANQEGSQRVKTQVLHVRAEPMRARWWWQRGWGNQRCAGAPVFYNQTQLGQTHISGKTTL